jgi:hypothetical protein
MCQPRPRKIFRNLREHVWDALLRPFCLQDSLVVWGTDDDGNIMTYEASEYAPPRLHA